MSKTCSRMLIVCLTLAAFATAAQAQVQHPIVLHVDHSFVVSGKVLPPGTYTVKRANEADPRFLVFTDGTNRVTSTVFPDWEHVGRSNQVSVTFEQIETQYFLRKIQTLNGTVEIPVNRAAILETLRQRSVSESLGKD